MREEQGERGAGLERSRIAARSWRLAASANRESVVGCPPAGMPRGNANSTAAETTLWARPSSASSYPRSLIPVATPPRGVVS